MTFCICYIQISKDDFQAS